MKKKRSDGERWRLLAHFLDSMEAAYRRYYPDDPCPMEGGYEAALRRLFESEFAQREHP